jgi:hypothetical protein
MFIFSLKVIGELLMELTVEAVIKDINMSLPERKINQLIERTNLSADLKATMADNTPSRSKASAICQSKGRSLLSQHNVPAVSGHIQSNWSQGCLK